MLSGLVDDTREISPLDETQIRDECTVLKEKGINDIAVIGIFSPLDINGRHEARVKQIILEEMPRGRCCAFERK
jgi:N-methylhydantoinase A/oxoprolinase/acetone carboxylase beta subunit